jgi:hypothetical protein
MLLVNKSQDRAVRRGRYLKLLLLILVLVGLHFTGVWLEEQINIGGITPRQAAMRDLLILGVVLFYILLMAMPFMPGMEIGLGLMMLLGSKGAVLVYLSTLAALSISYLVGRLIPSALICRFLQWLHLERARLLVLQLEPLGRSERLRLLQDQLPDKVALFLVNHRYLSIAAILNMPGNALIGGGGGIGLMVGMSRIIPYWGYLALLSLAVAPIPLWFYFG